MKKRLHFIGIKGVGMTALAIYAKERGFLVTGSDVEEVFLTDEVLQRFSLRAEIGFVKKKFKVKPDMVIVTGAHGGLDNPEARAYRKEGIEVISQAEALGRYMEKKEGISVGGVGGKTTTSAMIATILSKNNFDPSFIIGVSDIFPLGQPGHYGKGKYFIAEADEYAISPRVDPRPRFFFQKPETIVLTNVEYDHPDIYSSLAETMAVFQSFVETLPEDGLLVINIDNENNRVFKNLVRKKTATYGFSPLADYQIEKIHYYEQTTTFTLRQGNITLGEFTIKIPGKFNILNATAAIIVSLNLGLATSQIQKGLAEFAGTKRRFEFVGEKNDIKVYDDYAHHPSEIKTTLMAVKEWFPDHQIVCLFQPHTYSRTKALLNDFAQSFGFANEVIVLPIFPSAREKTDPSVNSQLLVNKISNFHPHALYEKEEEKIIKEIAKINQPTIVVTMGAGDVYKWGPKILKNFS